MINAKQNDRLINRAERLDNLDARLTGKTNNAMLSDEFRIFRSSDCLPGVTIPYRRREYYKVSLLSGEYIIHYKDESLKVSGTSLSFFCPFIPYTIEVISQEDNGSYFIFTESYYDNFFKQGIKLFPLFGKESKPIFLLNEGQVQDVKTLISKIEIHSQSDYAQKSDLIRNYINELMHYANSLQPASERHYSFSSKDRLYTIFNEILDRQFPVDLSNRQPLRTAGEFAAALNVHVNYLNRTLREITGKSTSMLFHERLLQESVILLKHTSWSISEIAYSLGFKDVSHFNHFFRKQADAKPSAYRN